MSESATADRPATTDASDHDDLDRADMLAQVEALRSENERLRAAYHDAQRQRYRRTAVGFGVIGLLALAGGTLFPGVRTILLAIGGTGLFAAVMTLYLTPESFVPASIGEAVSRTHSDNMAAIAADLGLSEKRVYLRAGDDTRLYLPQYDDYELPAADALSTPFVTTDNTRERGLSLKPTGNTLYESFERAHSGPVPEGPAPLAQALTDAAIEQFELLARAEPDVESGRLAIGCAGAQITPLSALDHPVTSLVAVGLTTQLETPIAVTVQKSDDDRYDARLVFTWEGAEASSS
ncbi:hypothetical protein ACFPYI_18850 [Halomarina salina]|uniref:DUF7982 domain-containing protein n=1 Tax=Halomarina salina TaxID=1872699 RepID=A0ABD5RSM0_9EURY|nr:hypothetical protein [Halomarina salina]